MSSDDRDLLKALAKHQWLSCVVSVVMSVLLSGLISLGYFWALKHEVRDMLEKSRCNCDANRSQVHEQHVNVSPPWTREDTVREALKRKWEKDNDVRGMVNTEGSD